MIPMLSALDRRGLMAGRFAVQDTVWGLNFRTILGRITRNHAQRYEGPCMTDGVWVAELDPEHWVRAVIALSIYGDEPGILVQRSRIDVRLRGTRTFIRNASRAEVAP